MKYTFIICARCGVQSQPLLIDIGTFTLKERLQLMGWKQDRKAYYCPMCARQHETKQAEKAV